MCTAFCSLDTIICKNTKCGIQLCRTALDGFGCCTNGKDSFAKLCNRCVRGGCRLRHLIYHRFRFVHSHSKGRHRIRYHVRSISKGNIPGCCQVQDGRQRITHLLCIVSGKGKVIQCLCTLGCGKSRLCTHLLCQLGKGIHCIYGLTVYR